MTPEQASKSRTAQSWVEHPVNAGSQLLRKYVLRYLAIANKRIGEVKKLPQNPADPTNLLLYEAVDELITEIRDGKLDLYQTADITIKYMIAQKVNPSQTHHFRTYLFGFFRYRKLDPDEDEYDDAVTKVAAYDINTDETPDPTQIRKLLSSANPKMKGIIYTILCTFRRPGEVIQLRVADINFDTTPPTVTFKQSTTKTHDGTKCMLSREATEHLKTYLGNRKNQSPWLFPAQHEPERHLTRDGAIHLFNVARQRANLTTKTETGKRFTIHLHTLRTAAMATAKVHGFPTDWTETLAGHRTGTQSHYLPDFRTYSRLWTEKVEPHLNYLTNPTDQPVEEFNKRITRLEEQLKEANMDRSIAIATFHLLADMRNGSDTTQSAAQLIATMREAVSPERLAEFDNDFTAKWKEILMKNPNAPLARTIMNMAYPITATPITVTHQESSR